MVMEENFTSRLQKMEDKVTELDKTSSVSQAVTNAILQRNLEVQERFSVSLDKLSEAVTDVKTAMSAIQKEIRENAEKTASITDRMNEIRDVSVRIENVTAKTANLEEKVKSLETKVENHENAHKIDVLSIIRTNVLYLLSIGGVIGIILFAIEMFKK